MQLTMATNTVSRLPTCIPGGRILETEFELEKLKYTNPNYIWVAIDRITG